MQVGIYNPVKHNHLAVKCYGPDSLPKDCPRCQEMVNGTGENLNNPIVWINGAWVGNTKLGQELLC